MEPGYLKISRKLFEHELWNLKREFSKAEAWIDLLAMASYDEKEKSKLIGYKIVKWNRGEVPASVRFLQKRWNWGSSKRVFLYLSWLQEQSMVRLKKETGQYVVSICNYESYNPLEIPGKQKGNTKETDGKQTGNKTNKDNKDNNISDNVLYADSPKSAEPTLFELEVEFWLKVVHPGWIFNATQGKSLKEINTKLKKTLKASNCPVKDVNVLALFKRFCTNLPEWFKEKDLQVLNGSYNQIIEEIKNAPKEAAIIPIKKYTQSEVDSLFAPPIAK